MLTCKQLVPFSASIDISEIFSDFEFKLEAFDSIVVDFLNDLSRKLLKDRQLINEPSMVALGFWLRKTNVQNMQAENICPNGVIRTPLGYVFHVCPSNVDTIFVYSLAISLLNGNKNILRISNRTNSTLLEILFLHINQLLALEKYSVLQNYIRVISYGHEKEINDFICMGVNARVLWGGDDTINAFKKFDVKPTTKDIAFPDRLSLAFIKTSEYNILSSADKNVVVQKFYNDSYTFDQKGCSSPQLITTFGSEVDKKAFLYDFYNRLLEVVEQKYQSDIMSIASLKLNFVVTDAIKSRIENVINSSNYLYFVEKSKRDIEHTCGGGYFNLLNLTTLDEIKFIINKKVQTISYYGLNREELCDLIRLSNGIGVDRIVKMGTALDFHYIWDGYNLIDELSSKKYFN